MRRGSVQAKIEVNFVMRGTVLPVRQAPLTQKARGVLMADLEIPVVSLDALLAARERLVREVQLGLDEHERRFLLSLVAGTPDWALLGIAHFESRAPAAFNSSED